MIDHAHGHQAILSPFFCGQQFLTGKKEHDVMKRKSCAEPMDRPYEFESGAFNAALMHKGKVHNTSAAIVAVVSENNTKKRRVRNLGDLGKISEGFF